MPTCDIEQGPQTISKYDVVGERAGEQTRFVRHVALFAEDKRSVKMGDQVAVFHMGPPIEKSTINVHMAGNVPLTNDDIKIISAWYDKFQDESRRPKWRQYVIHPPWKDEYDSKTRIPRYRRYSCAGFVLDGYLQVNIELLDIDENVLPEVDRKTLETAYPDFEQHPSFLRYLGIEDGKEEWSVVLAGYVLHALNRPTDQIRQGPYQAQKGDEQF